MMLVEGQSDLLVRELRRRSRLFLRLANTADHYLTRLAPRTNDIFTTKSSMYWLS